MSASAGALREGSGPLGWFAQRGSLLELPANTRFASASGEWEPVRGLTLSGDLSVGSTRADGLLLKLDQATSTSWSVGAALDCTRFDFSCSRLWFGLTRPLGLTRARVVATLADTPEGYFDDLTFSQRNVMISPSDRELDFNFGGSTDTRFGTFRLDLIGLHNEGNQKRAPLSYGLTASLRRRF